MRKVGLMFFLAWLLSTAIFNAFPLEIFSFNAKTRTLITDGRFTRAYFDTNGLPATLNPRVGEFRSPFYVVHYGLEYSEVCRKESDASAQYHWQEDPTLEFWPVSGQKLTVEKFRAASEWVVNNIQLDKYGNAHLYYEFDWPYENHPGGILKAPWWSGLTEGHAITLMLRAWDCFKDSKYLDAAEMLYESVTTPVSAGGSLLTLNGHPWIEEYVDPSAPPEELSRVLNGMAYAYFGIKAFEELFGGIGMGDNLKESLVENISVFGKGCWSYYDAIGSSANLKYHRVNQALLEDPRLYDDAFDEYIKNWRIGRYFTVPFFFLDGPTSIAKYHFLASYLALIIIIFLVIFFLNKAIRRMSDASQ